MNGSAAGFWSCGSVDDADIVGECLHRSVGAGPGAMEFGICWSVGGIEHSIDGLLVMHVGRVVMCRLT